MKKARITLLDGDFRDNFVLGMIDISHVYWKLATTEKLDHPVVRYIKGEKATDDEVREGCQLHVLQLPRVMYKDVLAWLQGVKEIDGNVYQERA
jgi:hypothetical protein